MPLRPVGTGQTRGGTGGETAAGVRRASVVAGRGDVLPGGVRVVSVQRDSAAGRVVVGSGDGGQRILYREDRLVVAHRVAIDGTTGSARHIGWLVGGLRRARRVRWRSWLTRR